MIIRVENNRKELSLGNNKISKSQQTLKQKKTQSTTSEKEGGIQGARAWNVRGGRTWRGTTPVKGRGSGHAESGGETSSMWEGGEMRTYQVELNLNFVHFLSLIVVIKFSCQDFYFWGNWELSKGRSNQETVSWWRNNKEKKKRVGLESEEMREGASTSDGEVDLHPEGGDEGGSGGNPGCEVDREVEMRVVLLEVEMKGDLVDFGCGKEVEGSGHAESGDETWDFIHVGKGVMRMYQAFLSRTWFKFCSFLVLDRCN